MSLPPDLPVPVDDGAADHLPGMQMPHIALPGTDGREVWVDHTPEPAKRFVIYAYPRTGQPGVEPLVPEWDSIPGARGCTPESCGFRDHSADLAAVGAAVAGLSTQRTDYQREVAQRLELPFALLSDASFALTD